MKETHTISFKISQKNHIYKPNNKPLNWSLELSWTSNLNVLCHSSRLHGKNKEASLALAKFG